MISKPLLLDVMLGDSHICQLRYTKHGYPELIDGEIIEVHREQDIRAFIEEERPSLRGKDFTVHFSEQRI